MVRLYIRHHACGDQYVYSESGDINIDADLDSSSMMGQDYMKRGREAGPWGRR